MASDISALLEQALSAWDKGDAHGALQQCDRMSMLGDEGRYSSALLRGRILLTMGDHIGALSTFDSVADPRIEDSVLDSMRGEALFLLGRFAEAQAALESAVRSDPTSAKSFYTLGLLKEYLSDPMSEMCFRSARQLEPKLYKPPFKMSLEGFTDAVVDALKGLPLRVQEVLEKVPLAVLEYPIQEDVLNPGLGLTPLSLGMFLGVQEAATGKSVTLPGGRKPMVILFRRNIERLAGSKQAVVNEIRQAILAEIVLPSFTEIAQNDDDTSF